MISPALRRVMQGDLGFESSLIYMTNSRPARAAKEGSISNKTTNSKAERMDF